MKIVAIGYTAHVRSEIVERLRRDGHDVVAATPRGRFKTMASRDPAYAGRHLRKFLENIASLLRDLWVGRHPSRGQPYPAPAVVRSMAERSSTAEGGMRLSTPPEPTVQSAPGSPTHRAISTAQ